MRCARSCLTASPPTTLSAGPCLSPGSKSNLIPGSGTAVTNANSDVHHRILSQCFTSGKETVDLNEPEHASKTTSILGMFHSTTKLIKLASHQKKLLDDFEGHSDERATVTDSTGRQVGPVIVPGSKVLQDDGLGPDGEPLTMVKMKGMDVHDKLNAFRNHKGSLMKSMGQYDMRRLIAQEAVENGGIKAVLSAEEAEIVHITMQGNSEMYSKDNQIKRSALKRSKKMRELASHAWKLAAGGKDHMNKAEFTVMITKFHILMVPPGGGDVDMLSLVEEEWAHDAFGKDFMDFEDFFTSLWQLVDTWTETVHEEEYVRMLQKVIIGTMHLQNSNLSWKEDKNIKCVCNHPTSPYYHPHTTIARHHRFIHHPLTHPFTAHHSPTPPKV
mmetsp:Transcript_23304/g.62542  ORF Transcript_23304/g.62542 Transcript_23304/m.62542 type:complete len:386 (+) Transcript_23304:331-1488(+)